MVQWTYNQDFKMAMLKSWINDLWKIEVRSIRLWKVGSFNISRENLLLLCKREVAQTTTKADVPIVVTHMVFDWNLYLKGSLIQWCLLAFFKLSLRVLSIIPEMTENNFMWYEIKWSATANPHPLSLIRPQSSGPRSKVRCTFCTLRRVSVRGMTPECQGNLSLHTHSLTTKFFSLFLHHSWHHFI